MPFSKYSSKQKKLARVAKPRTKITKADFFLCVKAKRKVAESKPRKVRFQTFAELSKFMEQNTKRQKKKKRRMTPETQKMLMDVLKVQPQSVAAPIRPSIGTNPVADAYFNYIQDDPVALQVSGGDPLKRLLRFASEFVPRVYLQNWQNEEEINSEKH